MITNYRLTSRKQEARNNQNAAVMLSIVEDFPDCLLRVLQVRSFLLWKFYNQQEY
jgi:hypothetical protein